MGGTRGVPAGSGVRTLAKGITAELVHTGRVDLRGHEVRSARDVATLAQVYRNPSFETFRVFYLREGRIVAHEGLTSRMPATAVVFLDRSGNDNAARAMYEMRDRMKRLGADAYYLLHLVVRTRRTDIVCATLPGK